MVPAPGWPAELPDDVKRLLWDVDPAGLDPALHRALLFERVMGRGSWEAMKWLRRTFPISQLAEFVREHGARRLSPRDLAYWALITGVEVDIPPGGGRPAWAGP